MNLREMNLLTEKNLLYYFYHINTNSDLKIPSNPSQHPEIFLTIFNKALNRIEKYNAFQNNDFYSYDSPKIFYAIIRKALFSQCILDTIISFKSYLLDDETIPFTPNNQYDLYRGYFSHTNGDSSLLSKKARYTIDRPMWQKIRNRIASAAENISSGNYRTRILDSLIPNLADWSNTPKWFIPRHNSDFIYHVMTNPDLNEFIHMIEHRLDDSGHFSNQYNKKLNQKLSEWELTDSMNFYTHKPGMTTRNDFFLFHDDPVDRLIFAQELERVFHFNLYHYLLSKNTVERFTDNKSYTDFLQLIKYMKRMPNPLTVTHVLNYALYSLDKPEDYFEKATFLEVLKDSGRPISGSPLFTYANIYFVWLNRTKDMLIYFATFFIPLLERTFLLLLLDAYGLDINNPPKPSLEMPLAHLHTFASNTEEKSLFWNDSSSGGDVSDLLTKKTILRNKVEIEDALELSATRPLADFYALLSEEQHASNKPHIGNLSAASDSSTASMQNNPDALCRDPELYQLVINNIYGTPDHIPPENYIHTIADKFLCNGDMVIAAAKSNYIYSIIDSHFNDYKKMDSKLK